jgi:SAM-dependent methyltransferase
VKSRKRAETDSEHLQRAHFDRVAARYEAHYDDPTSAEYRRRFINAPMFAGLELEGKRVLEAMCGSGQTTPFLLARGARVTGLDISEQAITSFRRRFPQCRGLVASMLDSGIAEASFDCVCVEAGLHHLHPHVEDCIDEIHRVLKPGGYFCFAEPHAGSLFDIARRFWYRRDPLFADNEASIDLDRLKTAQRDRFEFLVEHYLGNLAYMLVLQTMPLRLPVWPKSFYAPPLFAMESALGRMQGRRSSTMVAGQWRKK